MSIPAETLDRIQRLPDDQITVIMDLIDYYDQAHASTNSRTFINRIGDVTLITPLDKAKDVFLNSFDLFTDDFMSEGRAEIFDSKRETL